ncbi:MAG: glycosyltransferase [Bacteroidales bacterium]|nr:glycosyltransferase [Bacteroidales bacterium]
MNQPLLTVVVLTYMQQAYIARCLDGIVSQKTSFPFVVFVVDDASTDSTPKIVQEYADKYPPLIKPILLKENMFWTKKSFQLKVLPHITSKYTAFCEGDDFWTFDGKLQQQVEILEAHPEYSACCHQIEIKNEVNMPTPRQTYLRKPRIITPYELIIEHISQTNTFVIRTEVLHQPESFWEIYRKVFPFTDILIFAALSEMGSVYCLSEKWSTYRLQANGICTSSKLQLTPDQSQYIKERQLIEEFYGKGSAMDKWMQLYEALEQWTIFRRRGQYIHAFFKLGKAFIYHPGKFIRLYYNRYLNNHV